MTLISARFAYGTIISVEPTYGWIALNMALAGLWLAMLPHIGALGGRGVRLALLIGLLARLALWPSEAIWEDDYYRYLWDGGLVANGHNPYARTPAAARPELPFNRVDPALVDLGEQSGVVIGRVAYPDIKTIYPPLAQASFALAHAVDPWGLGGLKLVFLIADLATLTLMLRLLSRHRRPPGAVLLYWLCPLATTELHNALHMEVLLLPWLTAALLASGRARRYGTGIWVALAAGVKYWPVILAPLLTGAALRRPAASLGPVLVCAGFALLLTAPQLLGGGLDFNAGLASYSRSWQTNSFAFGGLALLLGEAARPAVAAILGALALLVTRLGDRIEAGLLLIGVFFLLSPTGYPWYWLWAAPFAILRPRAWWLCLVVMLPLYDLRFVAMAQGWEAGFNRWITALEFLPAWALLAYRYLPATARGSA